MAKSRNVTASFSGCWFDLEILKNQTHFLKKAGTSFAEQGQFITSTSGIIQLWHESWVLIVIMLMPPFYTVRPRKIYPNSAEIFLPGQDLKQRICLRT